MIGKIVEPALFANIAWKCQQQFAASTSNNDITNNSSESLTPPESPANIKPALSPDELFIARTRGPNNQVVLKDIKQEPIMASALNFKALYSMFQAKSSNSIVKSMKHNVDAFGDSSSSNGGSSGNEYKRRREKNNESVRKSRDKNRRKTQECAVQVDELRKENGHLVKTLGGLQNELFTLKSLFEHCFSFNSNNLTIKPSDIPTTTLYKMIINKELTSSIASMASSPEQSSPQSIESSPSSSDNINLTDKDMFYITEIKKASLQMVSSYNKLESAKSVDTPPATPPSNLSSSSSSPQVVDMASSPLDREYTQQNKQLSIR